MRIMVTAGGTEVPLDSVRVLTNRSKGTFLWAIACALADAGEEVTVIGSETLRDRVGSDIPARIRFVSFRTYDDLSRTLESEISSTPPDILLMGAAVSDYGPAAAVTGKIPSGAKMMTLRLRRLPKILDGLRERCGKRTFLVGFKLTAGVPDDATVAAARAQLVRAHLNLVVANDASRIGGGRHPVTLVTPEGGAVPIGGTRVEVATTIADFILRRAHTTWHRSVRVGPGGRSRNRSEGYKRASQALGFAQAAGLLHGSPGNMSAREGDWLWVTPRGDGAKERLAPHRLIAAHADRAAREVRYRGRSADKPSIDTPVHAAIYRACPEVAVLFHTHGAWLIPDTTTSFPYPCGSAEEATEIVETLQTVGDLESLSRFGIDLVHHGELIGVEANGHARLAGEWDAASKAYIRHLEEIGERENLDQLHLTPIFQGGTIVGVAATHRIKKWTSFFVNEEYRGRGIGPRLMELIDHRRQIVGVHDRCGVADFYLDRGFRIRETRGAIAVLEPPSLRDDVRAVVTVCLFCPTVGKLLLVRRSENMTTWPGKWANAGGKVEDGESLQEAAEREVREELGVAVSQYPATKTSKPCTLGWDRGRLAFRATTFMKLVPEPFTPALDLRESAESRWFTIEEARALPLAWATRKVLREFFPK